MLEASDTNKDHQIQFDEFVSLMTREMAAGKDNDPDTVGMCNVLIVVVISNRFIFFTFPFYFSITSQWLLSRCLMLIDLGFFTQTTFAL